MNSKINLTRISKLQLIHFKGGNVNQDLQSAQDQATYQAEEINESL